MRIRKISRHGRLLRFLPCLGALLMAVFTGGCLCALRDRNPGYNLAINIDSQAAQANPRPLRVGFGRVKINPDLTADKVWLAGFGRGRAATKIHDDLWAVACVLDDGHTRLGVVALDAIGFFHDDVIKVRSRLAPEWKLDYTIICSTHDHSAPDLLGLWGPGLRTGMDPRYREQVTAAAARALGEAATSLQPARVAFHEIATPTAGLVADTRPPEVYDPDIRVMHFTAPTTGATLGSIVGWANHPETVWADNTEITADFPGYLRDILENGDTQDGRQFARGLGGTHLYINGAIGGLMCTDPRTTVRDPGLEQDFQKPTHEKARALGRQLASRILPRLQAAGPPATNHAPISIRAHTMEMPLRNNLYLAATLAGILDRGQPRWRTLRTEVALVTFGEASIAAIPGEIYPEIVNGGIERPPGGDYPGEPLEVPPLRELMPGRIKFIFGLANDEIGYLIPKSEWDRKPPYLYGAKEKHYGEINSVGPDAAAQIHGALRRLCQPLRP